MIVMEENGDKNFTPNIFFKIKGEQVYSCSPGNENFKIPGPH